MVYEPRNQSMAWMETDYSKHKHFQWKIKWRLEYLGTLGIMSETAPLIISCPSGGPLHVQGILGTVGKMMPLGVRSFGPIPE